jgi:hypothetical protein
VIIYDFNVVGLAVAPDEANPPLIIDPDAMLAGPITFERLEPVAGRNAQILQPPGCMKVEEPAPGHALDRAEPPHGLILEEGLGVTAAKRSDQEPVYDAESIPSIVTPLRSWGI